MLLRQFIMGSLLCSTRGQESCGIAANNNGEIHVHKDMGLVSEVFNEGSLCGLTGKVAIGHVRYSTTGQSVRENAPAAGYPLQQGPDGSGAQWQFVQY